MLRIFAKNVERAHYIMGDPGHFMGSTKIEVPEKYFTIK